MSDDFDITHDDIVQWIKSKQAPSSESTCNECAQAGSCEYAHDAYNIDGDCLADK